MYGRLFGNGVGPGAIGGTAVLGNQIAQHTVPGGIGFVQMLFVVVGTATLVAAASALFRLVPRPQL